MKRLILLLPFLAACGTPQEQCIAKVTRDQRVVETLIAEAEGNLARGYALEEYTAYELDWQICHRQPLQPSLPAKGHKPLPPHMCWEREPVTRTRPVAIDLGAEAVKLAQLRDRRAALIRAASPAVAQCKTQFPE
ncbi:hypothetical protein SAMN04488103_106132 [Gemmobacter aquatilis]|uniref:Uncharacterized protein n=1 Tax=Gemmobacter aquatilis TaxID=933059 RepID=A0A1H8I4M5_9RHOB|nr:hypothetical protein [Gemmobacter aquatilis]SEN63760.1 hypothetical protein SAMN04488103_106132 [Gemmobacter aquatilis]